MALSTSERELINPVTGDRMPNVLGAVAAVARTAEGDLGLSTFARSEIAVVDGMRPHVLRSPVQPCTHAAVQRHLHRMEVTLSILSLLVHAPKRRQRPHLCDRVNVVDVLSCKE